MRNLFEIKKNHLFVSRGATAIYLILCKERIYGKKVLLPSNICYAAVYPVIYSGNSPIFCDVDVKTGNVTKEIVDKFCRDVDVMILPHMYGNPISDIEAISEICHNQEVLFVEDCASAMGASVNGKCCGSWGDYSVFSTGYSKTIDIGYGGMIFSDRSLERERELYQELPYRSLQDEEDEAFFSKLYRLIRNNDSQMLSSYIWATFLDKVKRLFIYRMNYNENELYDILRNLDRVVTQRRQEMLLYRDSIIQCSSFSVYQYSVEAVPWRFSLLVAREHRKSFIQYLLDKGVPVSDWYPVVTPIFGIENQYEAATEMEREIVNFPLMIGNEKVLKISEYINSYSWIRTD